jgi:hypothetical protein
METLRPEISGARLSKKPARSQRFQSVIQRMSFVVISGQLREEISVQQEPRSTNEC